MGGMKQKKANKHKNKGSGAKSDASHAMKPVTIADISPEFQTIILDFLRDIDCSFPEYRETLARYLGYSHEMKPMPDELYIELYTHCREVYPVRFFDILYKNESLFTSSTGHSTVSDASRESGAGSAGATNNATGADKAQASEVGSADRVSNEFLPGVDFREIWATEDITDNTKDIIWKYLQLILFSIVNNLSDMGSFGDTAKLFEAIDDSELKNKLEEVISEMGTMFGNAEAAAAAAAGANGGEGTEGLDETFKKATEFMNEAFAGTGTGAAGPTPPPTMPDASSIHEHLSGILNGKIGKLAKEIAEETAADLNLDMANETSMKGVFQQLLKNPGKLSGIIKTVGSKLDTKLKSGELKESEIMQEASELMSKMKNMPGMNNLASMLSKMGMNVPGGMGGGGGAKVNFGAMQSQLNRNMKQAQMRERLLKKVQEKQQAAAAASAASAASASAASLPANGKTTAVFQSGEKPAKTPRTTAAHTPASTSAPAPCVSAVSAPCVSAAPAPNVASAASTQGLSNSQGNVKQKSD
jgi:hypothetical protein